MIKNIIKNLKPSSTLLMNEESKKLDHQSSVERYFSLKKFFKNRVGLLHGSLKKDEKI